MQESWRLRVVPDPAALSEAAADIVSAAVQQNPRAAIAVPTGKTPLGMFDVLAARAARGEIDFSQVTLFCLDEYLGAGPTDPNSLTRWLYESFIDRVGIMRDNVHVMAATDSDPKAAAQRYEDELREAGGLDLAVLGMGANGHIAFNEPGSAAASRTRMLALAPESIAQAAAYWHDSLPLPSHAISMGVGTLLEARQLALIVTGTSKANVLRMALEEPVSADVPASWLRLAGSRLDVLVDADAASLLHRDPTEAKR